MKLIKDLINYIVNYYNDEEWYIFYDTLLVVKKYNDLDYIDTETMSNLINILHKVNDNNVKSGMIEIISNYLCCQYDEGEKLLCDDIESLFYEYINAISETTIDINETKKCLSSFIDLGIQEEKVILSVVENLKGKDATRILMFLVTYDEKKVSEKLHKIYDDVNKAKRIYQRCNIISTFILIVHHLCSKYGDIYCVSNEYKSLESAVEDWGWNTLGSTNYLVREKIFTKKEGSILERLGILLLNNVDISSSEIRELYFEFFDKKDPYDVMFTLPL